MIPTIRPMLVAALVLVAATTLAAPAPAAAHPLGNFTVNHFTRLTVQRDRVDVRYVVDMAEIPTFTERAAIDVDGDGTVTRDEEDRYLAGRVPELADALELTVGGDRLELRPGGHALTFPTGQEGLPTMRLELELTAEMPPGATGARYVDGTFPDQLGWREVIVVAGASVALTSSDVPVTSASDELRSYPTGGLEAPMDVVSASFRFEGAPGGDATPVLRDRASAGTPATDPLAGIFGGPLSPAGILVAVAISVGLGVVHALSPGHGKTLVAAYLVGGRGRLRDAVRLGVAVAVAHTAGVAVLGAVTLVATEARLPELLVRSLSLVAAATVVVLGVSLAWPRLRRRIRSDRGSAGHHGHHEHDHSHAADAAHGHPHPHVHEPTDGISTRGLLGLGLAGGLVPSASALLVLLVAISLDRVALGVVLVLAFGAGMAIALSAVSAGVVLLRGRASALGIARFGIGRRIAPLIPIGSAMVVIVIGLVMSSQTAVALATAVMR